MTPLISVIIPVYNVAPYLKRCLDSVIRQTFRDIEIICVNDGSTDNSLEILQEYAARDERIILINQENQGVSAARNAGIRRASAEWISFVDSDDDIKNDLYQYISTYLDQNIGAVCFGITECIPDGFSFKEIKSPCLDAQFNGIHQVNDQLFLFISKMGCNKLYRKSLINKYNLFFPEGIRYEDAVFTLNYISICKNIYFISKPFYHYYKHGESFSCSSQGKKEGIAIYNIILLDYIYQFWSEHKYLPEHLNIFKSLCFSFFRAAVRDCLPHEQACILWEMTKRLRQWDIACKPDSPLAHIKNGSYHIYLGDHLIKTPLTALKPLRGFQKIFYIGNERDDKVVRLFSCKIFQWKRR